MHSVSAMRKVLYISIYGCWPDFINIDKKIIDHLMQNKYRVDILGCDGSLPICDQTISYEKAYNISKEMTCQFCKVSRENISGNAKYFFEAENYDIVQNKDIKELGEEDGFNFTTLCNQRKISSRYYIEMNQNDQEVKNMIVSSQIILLRLKNLLEKEKYDLAIMTHPHRTLMSTIEKCLTDNDIPVLGYVDAGAADQDSFMMYSMDETLTPRIRSQISIWEDRCKIAYIQNKKWESYKAALSDTYKLVDSKSYKPQNEEWVWQTEIRPETKADTFNNLKKIVELIREYDTCICLFTSTESENQAMYTDNKYNVQLQLRQDIKKLALRRNKTLFIIREHPNRMISRASREKEISYWYDNKACEKYISDEKIDNLFVIHPWDKISSHELIDKIDIAICPITSLALDSFMLGKMVVTGPYSQFTGIADHVLSIVNEDSNYEKEIEDLMNNHQKWLKCKLKTTILRRFSEKDEAFLDLTCYALPYYKISRRELTVTGSKVRLSEHIDRYLELKDTKTFNQCITHVLSNNDNHYRYLAKERYEQYLRDARLQEKKIISYCENINKIKRKKKDRHCLKFLKGTRVVEVKIDEHKYNIYMTRSDCKRLEDLNKLSKIYLSDMALIGNDGLLESNWEISNNIDSLISKIKKFINQDQRAVYELLFKSLMINNNTIDEKFSDKIQKQNDYEFAINDLIRKGLLCYIEKPLVVLDCVQPKS